MQRCNVAIFRKSSLFGVFSLLFRVPKPDFRLSLPCLDTLTASDNVARHLQRYMQRATLPFWHTLPRLMSAFADLEILLEKLRLPSPRELAPWLGKLLEHPDSVIIIAIEKPLGPDGPHVATGWLSSPERDALRKGLLALNARRAKKGQLPTTEIPQENPKPIAPRGTTVDSARNGDERRRCGAPAENA
jgi:hypothetical protein